MKEKIDASTTQPKAGDQYGEWALVGRIGRGGNGEVWKALQSGKGEVAIKLLTKPKQIAYNRFRDEIKVMAGCGVPGVVPIIDHYLPDDYSKERAWYAMPLGVPLVAALKGAPLNLIVASVAAVAETMSALHAKKIHHRDIKPENLLLLAGDTYVGDFGLVDYPEKKKFTFIKERLGPRWTMAPEVVRQGSAANPANADVYSLGKTLWILITGIEQGFDGQYAPNSTASIAAHAYGWFIEPLEEILSAATEHEPGKRPTMGELGGRLREWLKLESNYDARNTLEWEHVQRSLFPVVTPARAVWTNPVEIVNLLDLLGRRSNMNHMFLPGGGGLDLSGAHLSEREAGCIELEFGGVNHILKPRRLMFESFGFEPQWNYFRLETDSLEPSGVYSHYGEDEIHEELADLGTRGYVDRIYWDEGVYCDERLPQNARLIIRHFRGAFVIFQKTSSYNRVSSTYDGRHNIMTADEFRTYIGKIVLALKERAVKR